MFQIDITTMVNSRICEKICNLKLVIFKEYIPNFISENILWNVCVDKWKNILRRQLLLYHQKVFIVYIVKHVCVCVCVCVCGVYLHYNMVTWIHMLNRISI